MTVKAAGGPDRRLLLAIGVVAVALAAWIVLCAVLVLSTLGADQRDAVAALLGPGLPLLLLGWVIAVAAAGAGLAALHRRFVAAPARLLEQTRVLLTAPDAPRPAAIGPAELRALAEAIGRLATQRDELSRDIGRQVAQANARLRQERNRLAALMSELNQSVVVCNLDGRILLYNGQARRAFRAISEAPAVGDGADLIGIGRSIHAVFDRAIVTHALASIRRRLDAGDPMPSAQFVTATRTGHLLRAQMAPVRDAEDEGTPGTAAGTGMRISGFVLMLENVTGRLEAEMQRDRLLLPCQALHAGRLWLPWRGEECAFASDPEPWFTAFIRGDPVPWHDDPFDPMRPGP